MLEMSREEVCPYESVVAFIFVSHNSENKYSRANLYRSPDQPFFLDVYGTK